MTDIVERLRLEYQSIGAAIYADAADEIESLRMQLKQAEERAEYAWKNTNTIEKERQRLEALEKDAERYRWLLQWATTVRVQGGSYILTKNMDRMNSYIDAAMEESK